MSLIAGWSIAPGPADAQDENLEAPIKATFLYRFADFVTWPDQTFATPESPLNICIVGRDPFGSVLDEVMDGQKAAGRPLVIYRVEAVTPRTGCHILYLPGSRFQSVSAALRVAGDEPVLTVTDAAMNGDSRGIIHFEVIDNRVKFHIDDAEAARRGLNISSRLLGIALSVRRKDS